MTRWILEGDGRSTILITYTSHNKPNMLMGRLWCLAHSHFEPAWPFCKVYRRHWHTVLNKTSKRCSVLLLSLQGFPYNRSARALLATANAGVQQAMDHLLAFGDSPGMDEPLSPTPRTSPPPSTSPPLSQPDRHGLPPSTPREGRTAVRMFPSNNSNPNLNTSSMTNSYASQTSNTQNHSNPLPSSSYSVPSTSSTAYYPGSSIPYTSQPGLPFLRNPYEGQSSAHDSTSDSVNAYAAEYSPYGSANPPPPSYPVTPGSGSNSSVVRLVNPLHALSDSLQGLGLSGRDGGGGGSGSGSSGGGGPSERPNVFGGGYPGSGGSSAFSTVGVAGLVRREEAKTSDAGR